jgi:Pyruvate/2-oxoacid:ferredoxin oxidoreductase delta subunit
MVEKTARKIVTIDESKCNGCGVCIPACVEGALRIIEGKARLISDKYCDGLGACLGNCPQDAITVQERESEPFDEVATEEHMSKVEARQQAAGCPSATVAEFDRRPETTAVETDQESESRLAHWPVQLALVPPNAPFLQGADLVLAADCVPFAYRDFHRDFLGKRALLIACPKLDDFAAHQLKLTQILRLSGIRSVTVVHMEVPCCSGLSHMAREAIKTSGKDIPIADVTISIKGKVKSSEPARTVVRS